MAMNPRLLRPLATGFNPRQIAGLGAWYDATVASSITLTSGLVSQWNDLSGSGLHLTQSVEANRPGTGTIGGRTAIDFDGSNDYLDVSADLFPGTLFVVVEQDAVSQNGVPLSVVDASVNTSNAFWVANSEWRLIGFNASTASSYASSGGTASNGVPNLLAALFGAPRPSRVDGSPLAGTTNVTGGNQQGIVVGQRRINGSASHPLNGRIGEFMVYSRVLSASEVAKVEGYLAWKWGLQAQLPSNHPYAYSFPGFGSQPRPSNADALDWESAVYANSGSVSVGTLAAVNTFCNAIDAAGIRDRFYRLNLFCGNSDASLIAPRVPLYRGPSRTGTQYGNALDTNVNFVEGDYAETGASGGLTNNSSKRLLTGFKLNQLPDAVADNHIGAFAFAHTPTAANHWMIGSRESTGAIGYMRTSDSAGGTWTVNNGSGVSHAYIGEHPAALYLSSRRTATDMEIYENSTSRGTSSATSSTAPYDGDNWVFSVNNQGSSPGTFPFRLGGYTFGLGMTSGQVSSLASAWAAFNTSLSRT